MQGGRDARDLPAHSSTEYGLRPGGLWIVFARKTQTGVVGLEYYSPGLHPYRLNAYQMTGHGRGRCHYSGAKRALRGY